MVDVANGGALDAHYAPISTARKDGFLIFSSVA